MKWLDNKCGGADGAGVEWDGLNFFVAVNRGLDRSEIADIGEVYRGARGVIADGGPPKDCNFQKPTFNQLRLAAETYYGGQNTPRATKFRNEGLANGINH